MPPFPDPDDKLALAESCERCPNLVESRECISWGNGPVDAGIMVVGEAPGEGESDVPQWKGGNWTGMSYTNRRSGQKIRTVLADAGYGHEDCFFTAAVRCHPEGNRDPTAAELDNCRPYLRKEIEAIEPQAVVTTGKHATESVLAIEGETIDGFLDSVLDPKQCPSLGGTVVPILHPSYQEVWISRLGYDREEYVEAIRETLAAVGGDE